MRKVKPKQDEYVTGPALKAKKSEPRYPSMRLDLDTIPEAKNWKVGESYRIEVEVKMTGLSQSRYDNSAEFEIRKIEADDEVGEDK